MGVCPQFPSLRQNFANGRACWRQEQWELEASLGYTVTSCLKKVETKPTEEQNSRRNTGLPVVPFPPTPSLAPTASGAPQRKPHQHRPHPGTMQPLLPVLILLSRVSTPSQSYYVAEAVLELPL